MTATRTDRYGLPLTTPSALAAERQVDGVDRLLALDGGADDSFRAAIAADEGLAIAYADLAFVLSLTGQAAAAAEMATAARERLEGVSRRERQHVTALTAGVLGEAPKALGLIHEHLEDFPRDALLVYQAMLLTTFGGGARPKEDTLALYERVAPAFGDDWWFLGSFSFAHQELGRVADAWPLAERSISLHPRNGSAVHSLTHLFYESGDHPGGLTFLEEWQAGYDPRGLYRTHFDWHRTLHHIALEEADEAIALYTRAIHPPHGSGISILADTASLLWRFELGGSQVDPDQWAAISELATRTYPHAGFAFGDIHAAMAHVGAGEREHLRRLAEELDALGRQGHPTAGSVVLPVLEGLDAFKQGDYAASVAWIEPVIGHVVRVGGSRAQREVFEDTLLVGYLRAGRCQEAARLLRTRLDRRESSRDRRWLADRCVPAPGAPNRVSL